VSRRTAVRTCIGTNPGLGRLVAVRFAAQWGDGLFQAALGGAVLFNPEHRADPAAIAAGLAVLLLPYSVLGPFAGALLDRWDRRRVLLWTNVMRAVLIVVVSAALIGGVDRTWLFLGALGATGMSRFVLAGLSAALPHVVAPQRLVTVNSVLATAGSVVAVLGAGSALGVRSVVGAGDVGSGITTMVSALGALSAGLIAAGYASQALGPGVRAPGEVPALRAVAAGLTRGLRAAWHAPGVAAALLALGAHRIAFGINTLLALLLVRYAFTGRSSLLPAGIAGFGQFVAVGALGLLLAAVLTPLMVARLGKRKTITVALGVALAAQVLLVPTLEQGPVLLAAFVLGTAGQVVKLSADAAMQLQVDDPHRGQVFALQDAVFNVAYVLAVAAAALVVPADGRSVALALVGGAVYAVGLVGHLLVSHRKPHG
jgi:hypothetical protein